jgi:hypothetical protein
MTLQISTDQKLAADAVSLTSKMRPELAHGRRGRIASQLTAGAINCRETRPLPTARSRLSAGSRRR